MSTLPKIIAVDFDGTLFENAWPDVGAPIEKNINKLKAEQADGAKSFFGRTASANLWKRHFRSAKSRVSTSMLSMRICPKSQKHLGRTAGKSSPTSIGMIAQCLCPRRILENSPTGSTHSILSIISGLSSSPRS